MKLGAQSGKNIDMVSGPLFRNIIAYAVPLMLTGILQLLFNAADLVVVGRFCGRLSIAAVGATGAIINLIVNLFIGLSVGVGAALGKKMTDDNHLVYTMHGDGELQEGQIWEAVMFAGAKKVDNLISTVDYNHQQIDGTVEQVMDLGNLRAKFESFMWTVVTIENGNDMQQVLDGMEKAKSLTGKGKPVCVLLQSQMGYGVDFMQNTNKYHGSVLNEDDLKRALAQLPETELGDY